jgi:non-haem Fe2+, alpha-ketoglutarate-dependent halogenase
MASARINNQLGWVETAMTALSAEAVRHYHEEGYYSKVRVLSAAEAAQVRRHLEQYEGAGGTLSGPLRHKTHLLFTWLDELIRRPSILDAVEEIVGPNILCWGTSFFIKEARTPSFVSWHQDSTYWGLEPPDIVTAWVAISESTLENGAMRVVPGTHIGDQLAHRDTFAQDNMLSRGQEIAVEVDGSKAVDLVLQPGEMSLHHVRLIHGSEPNPSARRRIGFAIRYLPTHVRQTVGARDFATLVRGVDTYHNFEDEQRPDADMSPAARAFHARVTGVQQQVLMRETARAM